MPLGKVNAPLPADRSEEKVDMFSFWLGPLHSGNRHILAGMRAHALIFWVVVASLGGLLGEGIWMSCQTARHIPVETEKHEDMDIARDLHDVLNNTEQRGKLDGALIRRLQEIVRDARAQDVLPVRVQISEDLNPEGHTCLTDAGLSIQARAGDVLTGTIRTTDLRLMLFCKGLVGVSLCHERELEVASRKVQPCEKKHSSSLAPVPERSQPESTDPIRSKLDAALLSLLQTKGEGNEPFRAALSETLDVDLDRPDPLVGVLIRVKGGRIKQLLSNGFPVHTQIGDVVTAKIPISRLEELAGLSDVVSVEAGLIRDSLLDHNTPNIRADQIPVELEKRDEKEPAKD